MYNFYTTQYFIRIIMSDYQKNLYEGHTLLCFFQPIPPKMMKEYYHALHAVRLQQHDAGLPHPLGLPGGDELVDDALSHVVEVTELRLPQDQRVRVRH